MNEKPGMFEKWRNFALFFLAVIWLGVPWIVGLMTLLDWFWGIN